MPAELMISECKSSNFRCRYIAWFNDNYKITRAGKIRCVGSGDTKETAKMELIKEIFKHLKNGGSCYSDRTKKIFTLVDVIGKAAYE